LGLDYYSLVTTIGAHDASLALEGVFFMLLACKV
jgi:hypothetical protein